MIINFSTAAARSCCTGSNLDSEHKKWIQKLDCVTMMNLIDMISFDYDTKYAVAIILIIILFYYYSMYKSF